MRPKSKMSYNIILLDHVWSNPGTKLKTQWHRIRMIKILVLIWQILIFTWKWLTKWSGRKAKKNTDRQPLKSQPNTVVIFSIGSHWHCRSNIKPNWIEERHWLPSLRWNNVFSFHHYTTSPPPVSFFFLLLKILVRPWCFFIFGCCWIIIQFTSYSHISFHYIYTHNHYHLFSINKAMLFGHCSASIFCPRTGVDHDDDFFSYI